MLNRIVKVFLIGLASLFLLVSLLVIAAIISPNGSLLLPVEHKERFDHPGIADFPARLQASGRNIITADGEVIILHGLMPPDPARLYARNLFNQGFYSQIHDTGANAIRVAVHPERWERDPDYLWRYLDPIVSWAGEMDLYVIIDLHFIGNIETGGGSEMPDITTEPRQLAMDFWRQNAAYFRSAPNVVFDLWNEPAGGISGNTWQRYATELVQIIRAQGADQLVIVGGVEYSRDLSWVLNNPIADDNIAYASHIYPGHAQSSWDYWFGEASQQYPVLLGEWGFMDENRTEAPSYLAGSRAAYGEPLLQYLDERGIGWIACWYDDTWKPPMFEEDWQATTRFGQFVLERLRPSADQ